MDLMIEPGRLLPLRPDVTPQTSTLFRVSGLASDMLQGRRSAEGNAVRCRRSVQRLMELVFIAQSMPPVFITLCRDYGGVSELWV